ELRVPRHTGARVDDIDAVKNTYVVAAQAEVDTARKLGDGRLQLARGFLVGESHCLTVGGEVLRERDAAAGSADHQHRQTRSRTRAIAASAEISPAPQNVSAIRFSDHPSWWNV